MELNRMIDHTILKADAVEKEIRILCEEALEHNFKSVCINPSWVRLADGLLDGSEVEVCTVIGFPLGSSTTEVKVFETEDAIKNGADEIDMVINIGKLKDQDYKYVENDIKKVSDIVKENNKLLKVIIETSLLSKEEIVKICEILNNIGVDFGKTSTGFSTAGATVENIKLMRKTLNENIEIKASGGVRDKVFANELIKEGATRLGSSSGIAIVNS